MRSVFIRGIFYLATILCTIPGAGTAKAYIFSLSSQPDSTEVQRLLARADSLYRAGNLKEEQQVLTRALKRVQSSGKTPLINDITISLAESYIDADHPDTALVMLEKTLNRSPGQTNKIRALNLLGVAHRLRGQYEKALENHRAARALVDSVENPLLYGKIELNIATVYGNRGDFGTAFKHFLTSVKAAEASGDKMFLATALNNLGLAYKNAENLQDALYYLERSLQISKSIDNKVAMLRAYSNLAIVYKLMEKYDTAIAFHERALALHKQIRPEIPPFRMLYNLGQLYKEIGELEKAERYYLQSLAYCQKENIPQGLIYNYGGLANIAELRENYARARIYYRRARDVAQQIGAGLLEKLALESLYKLEKNAGNPSQALFYFEQFVALDDSLDVLAQEQKLADTKTKLSLNKQEEINELLREKQQQQNARISIQNWLIVAGVVILLIISVFLYLLYRSSEERKKINRQLQVKHQRLEDLNSIKDKMLAIIAHDLRSPLTAMHGMLYLMQEQELDKEQTSQMTTELSLSLDRSITMMDNMLVWARDQMAGLKLDIQPIVVKEIAAEVLKDYKISAEQKEIGLENGARSEHIVRADYNLIKLVMRNLISNSIKFCSRGDKIHIHTSAGTEAINITVEDTGTGMDEDLKRRLFSNPGATTRGTKDEKGSGLGLQLCKEFIEKQGGNIQVESIRGEGTKMIFNLPKV